MPEPCKSCDKRHTDFGGCRCQAFHLTGDAANTDPACGLAPQHHLVEHARREADVVPAVSVPLPLLARRAMMDPAAPKRSPKAPRGDHVDPGFS